MLEIKFTEEELNDLSKKINYVSATSSTTSIGYTIGDKNYVFWDYYCKNADCDCTDAQLFFAAQKGEEWDYDACDFVFDYKKRKIVSYSENAPIGLIDLVKADKGLVKIFQDRHIQIKQAFSKEMMKRQIESFRILTAATSAKLGRNDACFCGSRKKYKNCCAK